MKKIKTKFGDMFYELIPMNEYALLDSEERVFTYFKSKRQLKEYIKKMNSFDTLVDWLKTHDDVCWGSKEDIIEWTKDYHECNGREFDLCWLEDNYNKIGNTYILFEYSDCYL